MIRFLFVSLLLLSPVLALAQARDTRQLSVQSLSYHQLQTEAASNQRQFLYSSLAVLVLISALLFLLYRNNRQQQKLNALLQQQKIDRQTQRDLDQLARSELKATQTQLLQSEKMASLGELTAGIVHEIQNPLNFVTNFSDVSVDLLDELSEGPLQHMPASDQVYVAELLTNLTSNLQKIALHGRRASSIVKNMLEHSRISTGAVQAIDLNALADEYLRLAYHGQRAKDPDFNCALITQFSPAVGKVDVMVQEMGRVLLNLFTNAFYAVKAQEDWSRQQGIPYQPGVTVSTLRSGKHVQIRIYDNGTGMPERVKQQIFQPFFTTKPTGQGTGLGLSLAHDIITKGHRGLLTVTSQEGRGTTFVVDLPV